MKRSICAARDLEARRRIEAAAEVLADRFDAELVGINAHYRGTPDVVNMKRMEAVAETMDALEEASRDYGECPTPDCPSLADTIREASDEELLALPGIGKATVSALREGLES
jgi:hypothetical protein